MPDVALTAALREAYASVPVNQIIYDTVELWHPAFTVPIRCVSGKAPIEARIEAGAARDAGALVTFLAWAFRVVQPEVTAEAVPEAQLEIDNTGAELMAQLDLAVSSSEKVTLICRQYLSDRLTLGPETVPPLELMLTGISATDVSVTARAGFPNLVNRRFPRRRYDLRRFPGLQP